MRHAIEVRNSRSGRRRQALSSILPLADSLCGRYPSLVNPVGAAATAAKKRTNSSPKADPSRFLMMIPLVQMITDDDDILP